MIETSPAVTWAGTCRRKRTKSRQDPGFCLEHPHRWDRIAYEPPPLNQARQIMFRGPVSGRSACGGDDSCSSWAMEVRWVPTQECCRLRSGLHKLSVLGERLDHGLGD
eukprot:scaffold5572_cov390-Prasinococcus_capsulatus_cf.AAC.9